MIAVKQMLYCAICGLAQVQERASMFLAHCAACGSGVFTTMVPQVWTIYDKRFLRALHISTDDLIPPDHDEGDCA